MVSARKSINSLWTEIRNLAGRDPSIIIGTMLVLNLLRIVSSLVLTRLLAPADFGIVGLVTVAHYTINMLLDFGTDSFLVRHREIKDRAKLDAIWTVRFLRLIFVAIVTALASGIFSGLLGNDSLTIVLAVSALGFLASAPGSLSYSLAVRDKKLVLTSSIDIAVAVFNLVLTVAMSYWLRNYWALIISSIIGTSVRSVISYLLFPNPVYRFAYDPEIIEEMWHFSRYVIGSSAITLMLSQIDKFILGRFLTIGEFGVYMLAASLAYVPRMFCETYGSRVLFPTYAQAYRDDPSSIKEVFHAKLRRIGPLYCFMVGGLIGFAPIVISVMYQDRYANAAYYLALLSIPSFFALSGLAAVEALVAVGEVRAIYHANIVRVGWLIPTLGVAVSLGSTAAILAVLALSELPATVFSWAKLRSKGILSLRRELPAFVFGAFGIILGWALYRLLSLFYPIAPIGLLR
jgi:lipopolysaccharide exporter